MKSSFFHSAFLGNKDVLSRIDDFNREDPSTLLGMVGLIEKSLSEEDRTDSSKISDEVTPLVDATQGRR